MASADRDEVRFYEEGGVWKDSSETPTDDWKGEVAVSKVTEDKRDKQIAVPMTPSQEDREVIAGKLIDSEELPALAREIERIFLKNSGRSIQTSLVNQLSHEREDSIEKLRDWISAREQTESVKADQSVSGLRARITSLEEQVKTLQNKTDELMKVSVTNADQERSVVEEALRLLKTRREDEIGSDQTPSDYKRLQDRADELNVHVDRFRNQAQIPPSNQPRAIISRNKKKFGSLM